MRWLVRQAMCALYPETDDLMGIEAANVDAFLTRFRKETTPLMWTGVVAGSAVFAATPILTLGIPAPAFLLPKKLLDRHADRVASHPVYLVRQAVFLVKLPAGLCWGAHDTIRQQYGLDPYPDDPGSWRRQ
ncbi:MAG: hypothetical protein AAGF12_06795 [Myxococcota bacterium]